MTQEKTKETIPQYNYEEKEAEYAQLLVEGEVDKGARLRREIDNARFTEIKAQLEAAKDEILKASETKSKDQIDTDRFNTLVEVYEQQHPFLDSSHEDYNEDAVETVNTLMLGLTSAGKSKSDALKEAVKKVTKFYKKSNKVESTDRKSKAVKKNIEASKQQPGKAPSRKTRDTLDIDITRISDKDFDQLSRRELAELRGDFVG